MIQIDFNTDSVYYIISKVFTTLYRNQINQSKLQKCSERRQ